VWLGLQENLASKVKIGGWAKRSSGWAKPNPCPTLVTPLCTSDYSTLEIKLEIYHGDYLSYCAFSQTLLINFNRMKSICSVI